MYMFSVFQKINVFYLPHRCILIYYSRRVVGRYELFRRILLRSDSHSAFFFETKHVSFGLYNTALMLYNGYIGRI